MGWINDMWSRKTASDGMDNVPEKTDQNREIPQVPGVASEFSSRLFPDRPSIPNLSPLKGVSCHSPGCTNHVYTQDFPGQTGKCVMHGGIGAEGWVKDLRPLDEQGHRSQELSNQLADALGKPRHFLQPEIKGVQAVLPPVGQPESQGIQDYRHLNSEQGATHALNEGEFEEAKKRSGYPKHYLGSSWISRYTSESPITNP